MASGRSYLCNSKRCAALIASAITRSEFMRRKTHAELWRATPYSACPKNSRSEGIVSKRKHLMYRSGRSPDWLKMKSSDARAVKREAEDDWGRKNAMIGKKKGMIYGPKTDG